MHRAPPNPCDLRTGLRGAGDAGQYTGRGGVWEARGATPHSLSLHLLLLLEDLVGFHCQPLLHEKLLPPQLALPRLLQPLPVCQEQLPALRE